MMRLGIWVYLILAAGFLTAGEEQWVTFDGDAAAEVVAQLEAAGVDVVLDKYRRGDSIAVARLDAGETWRLTRIFHDQFNRCGGFLRHNSAQEAHTEKTWMSLNSRTTAKKRLVDYQIDNPDGVGLLLDQVDSGFIEDVIVHLASYPNRFYNTNEGAAASNWLRDHWAGLVADIPGAEASLYPHSFTQPSVILTIPGSELPDEVVVLGGHLDSTVFSGSSAPGADDDASGIATITEVVRVMAETGFRPKRTLSFMGYAGEEAGLLGSADIADHYRNTGVNVVGVLQLDMTNYNGSTEDIWFVDDFTNAPQNDFLRDLAATYLPELTTATTRCGYGCSDHASWHREGFPASFPFESRFGEHNSAIHSASDTFATSGGDASHAVKFARLAVCYVAELAKGGNGAPAPTMFLNTVSIATMLNILSEAGPCPTEGVCYRDLDNNGVINEGDVAQLKGLWSGRTCLGFTEGTPCEDAGF